MRVLYMQIKHLMSEDLITIDKDQNLSDALKLLYKNNISRLIVLNTNKNNQKELVGIISEKDIADKLGSSKYENIPSSRIHVSSVMIKDVISASETMDQKEVVDLMLENDIGSLPILKDQTLVGIVSKSDFITLANGKAFEKILVGDVMSYDIISVSPNERLVHARRLINDNKVGRLPVIVDEKLVGMITSKDLIRALIDFKKKVPEKYQKAQIKDVYVEDVMSDKPLCVYQDTTIAEVADMMMDTGYKGFPVVVENNIGGIITQTDILRLISQLESN